MARRRIASGRGGVEPVDVGEQHQQIGARHGGDAGGEPVVVAIANLGGGDGVVLVDHRHGAQIEQAAERGAGVEITAALFRVGQGQQDLAGGERVMAERLGPGAGQRDLSDRGGGLALLEAQRARGQAEDGAPQGDRARGDDEHIRAALMQIGEVLGESGEPGLTQATAVAVDEEARADLHHDATELVQRRRLHGEEIRRVAIAPPASWRKARRCKARERGGGGTVGAFARQLH